MTPEQRRAYKAAYMRDWSRRKAERDPDWAQSERERKSRRKREHGERVAAIKLERGCDDCGYAAHAQALEFDHRPGEVKCFDVSAGTNKTWDAIEAEIAKCDVVCANCHRLRTSSRRSA